MSPVICSPSSVEDLAEVAADAILANAEAGCFGCGDPLAQLDGGYCPACCGAAWTLAEVAS